MSVHKMCAHSKQTSNQSTHAKQHNEHELYNPICSMATRLQTNKKERKKKGSFSLMRHN
jgi:hypothetical protein